MGVCIWSLDLKWTPSLCKYRNQKGFQVKENNSDLNYRKELGAQYGQTRSNAPFLKSFPSGSLLLFWECYVETSRDCISNIPFQFFLKNRELDFHIHL